MEKVKIDAPKISKNHSVCLENRSKLVLTGVEKVVSSSDSSFSLLTSLGALVISGKNLKIESYNAVDGSFSADGEFDAIKYSFNKAPLLKRMFK